MNLNNKTIDVWNKSENCNCDDLDCAENHKLCGICGETIIYTAHVSNQPNSKYRWDIDHIIPKSRFGSNHISNLQVAHVICNQNKENY